MIISIVSYLIFIVVGLTMLIAFTKSKGVYSEHIDVLDKKNFELKNYLPIGLYLNENINPIKKMPYFVQQMYGKYSMHIRANVSALYGIKNAEFYYTIHCANRTLISIFALFGTSALGSLLCVKGTSNDAKLIVIGGILISLAMPYLYDKSLNDKLAERQLQIQLDFPEFLNKLLLLVNAGMTISRAFEKIMEGNKKNTPLYEELNITYGEIKAGTPETIAFENFARRCKIREIINFISVLVLNLKKGGAEVVPVLRAQSVECWEMRKTAAKRLGEEASSKMMLPITIMLIGILLVVGAPAVLMLNGSM